jgi:hypothetical protein
VTMSIDIPPFAVPRRAGTLSVGALTAENSDTLKGNFDHATPNVTTFNDAAALRARGPAFPGRKMSTNRLLKGQKILRN